MMKIEIQASGESKNDIGMAVEHIAAMIYSQPERNYWESSHLTAQASAVVVQEEKEGE